MALDLAVDRRVGVGPAPLGRVCAGSAAPRPRPACGRQRRPPAASGPRGRWPPGAARSGRRAVLAFSSDSRRSPSRRSKTMSASSARPRACRRVAASRRSPCQPMPGCARASSGASAKGSMSARSAKAAMAPRRSTRTSSQRSVAASARRRRPAPACSSCQAAVGVEAQLGAQVAGFEPGPGGGAGPAPRPSQGRPPAAPRGRPAAAAAAVGGPLAVGADAHQRAGRRCAGPGRPAGAAGGLTAAGRPSPRAGAGARCRAARPQLLERCAPCTRPCALGLQQQRLLAAGVEAPAACSRGAPPACRPAGPAAGLRPRCGMAGQRPSSVTLACALPPRGAQGAASGSRRSQRRQRGQVACLQVEAAGGRRGRRPAGRPGPCQQPVAAQLQLALHAARRWRRRRPGAGRARAAAPAARRPAASARCAPACRCRPALRQRQRRHAPGCAAAAGPATSCPTAGAAPRARPSLRARPPGHGVEVAERAAGAQLPGARPLRLRVDGQRGARGAGTRPQLAQRRGAGVGAAVDGQRHGCGLLRCGRRAWCAGPPPTGPARGARPARAGRARAGR
jgi:hypothetical protein